MAPLSEENAKRYQQIVKKHYVKDNRKNTRILKTPYTTLDYLHGFVTVQDLGVVYGTSVKTKSMITDVIAELKANTVGGNIDKYAEMLEEANEQAITRMLEKAISRDAHAVIGVKFTTSMISQGMSEVTAYGTAVKLKPIQTQDQTP